MIFRGKRLVKEDGETFIFPTCSNKPPFFCIYFVKNGSFNQKIPNADNEIFIYFNECFRIFHAIENTSIIQRVERDFHQANSEIITLFRNSDLCLSPLQYFK